SAPYVRQIIHSVQDDCFSIIYHNCGPGTAFMTDSLAENGAAAYHFGDAADMRSILETMPSDKPILGNLSPTRCFLCGTPENMYEETAALIRSCSGYGNFVLSSGCDIPAGAKWENICAFFRAAEDASIRKKAVSYRKSIHISIPRRVTI
ncbi:MAG: hypothetical protein IJC71_01960, partial [Clostridia bacterium]|nr:hypothetical protein [Clostridia bacterium]